MNKLILLIALLLCTPSWAVTDIPVSREWQLAGFGGGGAYMNIAFDIENSNILYVVSDVSGFFKSKDSAETWQFSQSGTASILNSHFLQSPSNPNVIYMAGRRIQKSVNRGRSWSQISSLTNNSQLTKGYQVVAIDPDDENIAYFALSDGTIRRTLNGGASELETYATPFGANIRARFLYIDTSGQYLFVGSEGLGMKRYDLTDDSVIDITLTGTNALYNSSYSAYTKDATEYLCVGAGLRIACSDDDGATWDYKTGVTEDTTFFISELVAVPLNNGNIRYVAYARRTNTRYGTNVAVVSSDNGATWTSFWESAAFESTILPTNVWSSFGDIGNVISIANDPNNEDSFALTTDGRVWKSTDGGYNWEPKDKYLQNVVVSDVTCSPRMSSGITRCFQAAMDVGLLYTDNVGDTWTAAFPNTSNDGPQGFAVGGHIWRVLTRGTQAEWDAGTGQVVATSSYWADMIPRAIISSDNGETWTIVTSGLPTTKLNSTGVPANESAWRGYGGVGRALAKCSDDDDILAIGIDGYSATENGGIFVSTNGGVDWTRTTQPGQWKIYNGISFDPSDNSCNTLIFTEWFHSGANTPKTWRTTDRGTTWTNVDSDIGIFDMQYHIDGKAYKVGLDTNPMIDRSVDGITWEAMKKLNTTSQIADGLWLDPTNANRICVGVNDGTNTGTSQGSGSDGSGAGGGSIYCTADAQNGSSATWYNITGDLPSPAGITAITAVYNYLGDDYLLVGIDGSGTFRLKLNDTTPTTISDVTWQ